MNKSNKQQIPVQTSIRMQVVQKLLTDSKPSESSSRQFLSKLLQNQKFTPVLRSKITSPKRNHSRPKESSIKQNMSIFRLHSTSSRDFHKTRMDRLSNSVSFETIKTSSQNRPEAKDSAQLTRIRKYKKNLKPRPNEGKIANKSDIDSLWRRVFFLSNGVECSPGTFYRVFIGKGNNSGLIKRVMAGRIWWKIVDQIENAQFVWTQWKDLQFIRSLKCCDSQVAEKEDQKLPPWPTVGKNFLPKSKIPEPEFFGLNLIQKAASFKIINSLKLESTEIVLYNKLEFNECLSDKKELLKTMKEFYASCKQDVFEKLPISFNVTGTDDSEFLMFLEKFQEFETAKKEGVFNVWIVKPGENSNRGNGIQVVSSLEDLKDRVISEPGKSYILQKYIENPLLINKRKFDIRCYAMITSINNVIQGYFFQDGYLRTSSIEFSMENLSNNFIHLTNDAIQKHSLDYGKFESSNKLSYKDLQRYLDLHHQELNFSNQILPKIKQIVKETIQASFLKINKNKRLCCFEIFGYDFMIDKDFKPWLIEVNTNPCLELASLNLRIVIPSLIENAVKLVVDSLFPPPGSQHADSIQVNKFELIFHSESEGKAF